MIGYQIRDLILYLQAERRKGVFMYTLVYVMKNIDTEEIIETTETPEKRYLENVCDYVCIDEFTRWEDEKEV